MNALLWFAWAAGLIVITLTTRNPLYLLLALGVTRVVNAGIPRNPTKAHLPLWRMALFIVPLSALFNAISVHIGDTVLFTIPGDIPVFSGAVTLEGLVYGTINGLMLVTVLSIFQTLNAATAPRDWMRFAPRSYQSIGMTMSIAMGFVPQVTRRLREVQDAQAVRGHRVKGIRDWLPLWVPLLTGGMEQSMQMSEAMVARGFGATQSEASSAKRQTLLAAGLLLALAGWFTRFFVALPAWLGWVAVIAGAAMVITSLIRRKGTPHTSLRDQRLTRRDWLYLVLFAVGVLAFVGPTVLGGAASLFWSPYPALTVPAFDLWLGLALLLFTAPIIQSFRQNEQNRQMNKQNTE
jgi:energy-coupling factor transport system permease protein